MFWLPMNSLDFLVNFTAPISKINRFKAASPIKGKIKEI
jgi:hypothetical protein